MADYILVVDDNLSNLDVLSILLENVGYAVQRSMYGSDALERIAKERPSLVLLDINMPDMSGIDVCKRIKAQPDLVDLPVIFLTSYDDIEMKQNAFRVGGVDYITKPFQAPEVLARVRSQLQIRAAFHQLEEMHEQERRYMHELLKLKDDFIHTTTHDLKNPLTSIRLSLEMMRMMHRDGRLTPERLTQYINQIEERVGNIMHLVTNILDLAGLETGRAITKDPVDLLPIIRTSIEGLREAASRKAIYFRLDCSDQSILLYGDETQLGRVFDNLFSNAIKYSSPDTDVTVWVRCQDGWVTIAVQDHGYGIPPDALEKIFQRFYRVETVEHRAQEGSGLGLSIVKSIVEQHGGSVHVTSEMQRGSVFTITLPLRVVFAGS